MNRVVMVLFTMAVAGCTLMAPFKPPSMEANQHIYGHDYETTWRVALETVSSQGLPIKTLVKEEGVITTDFVLVDLSSSSENPKSPAQKAFEKVLQVRYKLRISVKSIEEQNEEYTVVVIDADYERYSQITGIVGAEDSPTWKAQESPGTVESRLLEEIRLVLSPSY